MLHKNIPYRRRVKRKYQRKLQRMANKIAYCPSGAYKVEIDGKIYYRRYYRGRASQYLKRQSAKRSRRYSKNLIDECTPSKRNYYRKEYDFWWELY